MSPSAGFHALTRGPVLIIGTGLLGTSIGLALSRAQVPILLEDISPTSVMLARDMGAGELYGKDSPAPKLVVIATPPDVTGKLVLESLDRFPEAIVTDVASVKSGITEQVEAHPESARYIGSHPMAGRENSGPAAADADLFYGRAWVLVAHKDTSAEAVSVARTLAYDLGGEVRELDAQSHDRAVAVVSHVPQLLSSLLAGYLRHIDTDSLALAGGGLRDMTRIAGSDPALWTAITIANAQAVSDVLADINHNCERLIEDLRLAAESIARSGPHAGVHQVLLAGNQGVAKIPGKHGGAPTSTEELGILVPDSAGELGRLFNEVGHAGVNIEDLRIEHSAGQPVGLVWLSIQADKTAYLVEFLESRQWRVVTA